MLRVRDLTRRYGARLALDGVSLDVSAGEIVGLLGANGAGKSTLLRIAAGLQPPDAGRVELNGVDLWHSPVEAKRALGYAAEEPAFYEELSADEHFAFVAAVRGLDPGAARERCAALCTALALDGRTDEPVKQLSHGTRKKLSFIAAVMHRPRVLLCDEALEGFDAVAAIAARDELRARATGGSAVLFSSHVTETLERLCDRVVMLHHGRVVCTLERASWGSTDHGPSALEREFLRTANPPHPEIIR